MIYADPCLLFQIVGRYEHVIVYQSYEGGMKMTIWYSKNRMYRVDEFDDGSRFLLKRVYTNLRGECMYDVVRKLTKEQTKETAKEE